MKRYSISLGNFKTQIEAVKFIKTLVGNYVEGWTPGDPTLFPEHCSVEEFEQEESTQ